MKILKPPFLYWALLPYYLNDFFFIRFQTHFYIILALDYTCRFLVLGVIVLALVSKKITAATLGLHGISKKVFWLGTLSLTIIGIAINRITFWFLNPIFVNLSLYKFPPYPNSIIHIVDLTFGLLLVAVTEEILFRGWLISWLRELKIKPILIVLLQSFLFGMIHWSSGPANVINGFLWGIAPGFFVLRYRSIYPSIIAHYITNLVEV